MKNIYGILVWFTATLFVTYAFCLNTAAAVFADSIKTSLSASDLETSLAVGSFVLGFAGMQIPAGYLLDNYSPKWVVSIGVFLLALGNLLISFAGSITLFSLANLIQGIGGSFAFIAAGVLISQWFDKKMFPVLFGLTQTISCCLASVAHYIFVHVLKMISWNLLYQYLSIFGFILFIITLIIIKKPQNYPVTKTIALRQSLSIVLKNKQIWLCAIAAATSFGILIAYGSFWYVPIQAFYAINNDDALIISGMIFIGIGFGTPILGWLSNKMHSRKMLIHISLVVGNMMLLLAIYLPHFNISTLIIIKTISFLVGFLLSGAMLFYTIVSEISSNTTRGVALSLTNTLVFLMNTIMMFIPYLFITTISKSFFTYLWILPFSIMISILLVYFIHDSYKKGE